MKILPLVKEFRNDITSSGSRLKKASTEGYNIANRTSKIYKQGFYKKYLNIPRCVTRKVVSGTSKKEIPYLVGAIGLFIPIPLMSPILFALGRLALIPSMRENTSNEQSKAQADSIEVLSKK